MSEKTHRRQYQGIGWGSKNKFACRGVFIHGPDRYYYWGAISLLIFAGVCYFIFVVPMLIQEDIFPRWYNVANVPLFGVIWLFTICMHLTVAYMDPGILPRKEKIKYQETGDAYLDAINSPPTTKQIIVKNKSITCKLCSTCNIYRPPRTVHCSTCDNCVMRFDHHCPYVGNCVGLRNYKFFLYFLVGVLTTSLFALTHCIAFVATRVRSRGWSDGFAAAKHNFIVAWLLGLLSVIAICLILILIVWTIYLVSMGRTTYEKIKLEKVLTPNPFDHGIFGNWIKMLCAPNYPRFIYPRRHVPKETKLTVGEVI